MIKRYLVPEIDDLWTDESKYNVWLDVEKFVVQGWAELGVVPKNDLLEIEQLKVNRARMLELELETKHDVVAFTRMLSEQIGNASRWIHLGITSTDIVDTAQNYLLKKANDIIAQNLTKLTTILKELAFKHQNLLIMGRTHGMYGEPTSLGLKFALWYEELNRQITRFNLAREQIELAKISGSMGNYANLELEVEIFVAQKLNLGLDSLSTQITQRDRHAFLVEVFANIASTLEKMTTEIRLFQRSDVNEMAEGFSQNQKGSSSMPHKKNPISSENIAGLSRYIRTYVPMVLENNNLWHERDISHSSNERIMFPDLYNVLVYVLKRMQETLTNLYINEAQIQKHIQESRNIFFSQRVLTYILMQNNQVTREEVYDLIQKCTLETLNSDLDFKNSLIKNGITRYVESTDLNNLFDLEFFLRQTQKIFKRVFK